MRNTRISTCIAAAVVLALTAGCSSCPDLPSLPDVGSLFDSDCAPPTPCDPPPVVAQAPCDPPPVACAPEPVAQPMGRPDARPGEVWCYVRVPAVTRTEEERICVRPESYRDIPVPAVTQQVERRVCVRQPATRQETIPAEFQDVPEQICVAQARTEWQRVDCNPTHLQANEKVGECWTLRELPAQYQTQTKRVCVRQEACRTIEIPAEFETRYETVVVTPACSRREMIPAQYETRLKEVVVCGPKWEWRRTTECEVPMEATGDYVPAPADSYMPAPADSYLPGPEAPIGSPDSDAPPAGGLPPLR